jgi:thiamine kinase-like enzyme
MLRNSLEELASHRVPGTGPVDIHPLQSGLVNASFRVGRAGRLYWMRVAAPTPQDLGLDRAWECRVLSVAAAAGVAPQIEYCDPMQGILVAQWTVGRPWTREEVGRPATIDAMARLLRRVHALAMPAPPRVMSPAAWVERYAGTLQQHGIGAAPRWAQLRGGLEVHLRTLAAAPPVPAVLCHSDLHILNVLAGSEGSAPVLLDWEYAHASDPLWDLAGWIANNDWAEDLAGDFLASYLQRPARCAEWVRLRSLVWLYDYVCLQWSELYLRQRGAAEAVLSRAERLEGRLRRASGSRAR